MPGMRPSLPLGDFVAPEVGAAAPAKQESSSSGTTFKWELATPAKYCTFIAQ